MQKNLLACAMRHTDHSSTTAYEVPGYVWIPRYISLVNIIQLYTLYLEPSNFSAVAYPLYVASASSNPLVRASISHQLRSAAEAELLKNSSIIDIDDLYSEADKAFEALSILLGDDPWFFGCDKPTLFDASIFAYTQLLLDEKMGWKEQKLCRALQRRENLVQHRKRLLVCYFGG